MQRMTRQQLTNKLSIIVTHSQDKQEEYVVYGFIHSENEAILYDLEQL
jgi:hypothetical protein